MPTDDRRVDNAILKCGVTIIIVAAVTDYTMLIRDQVQMHVLRTWSWIVISSKNLGIYRHRTSRNEDVNKICLICNKLMVFFLSMKDCPDQLVTFVFGISIEERFDWKDICDLLKNYSVTCPSSTFEFEMMYTVVRDGNVIREIEANQMVIQNKL